MNINPYFFLLAKPFRAFHLSFLFAGILLATAALAPAGVIFVPSDNGDNGGDLWAELFVEVSGSPSFNPLLHGGTGGGSWIWETDQWSGYSYPPNSHIVVEEGGFGGGNDFFFEAKSQAGFNATGLSVLKNYLKVSGPGVVSSSPVDPNGDEPEEDPPTDHEAWSWAQSSHQFIIEAPEGFWDPDETYNLHHDFVVSGILSKSANTIVNLDFHADPGLDISGGSSWNRHYGEEAGVMNEVPFSETLEAQWDPRWGETGATPGVFGLMHSVSISIYADSSVDGFSAEVDLFNTSQTSAISLVTVDGEGNAETIVTFDSMGNVIAGNPAFSLVTPVPEPATYAVFLAAVALGLVLLRRRIRR